MSQKLAVVQSEYLIHNAIDSEIYSFLRPLIFIQSTFFISMYTIRDNFIIYKDRVSITLSFLSVIIATIIYTVRVVLYTFVDTFVYINNLFDSVYYSCGFALICFVSLVYQDSNIDLVLKIQSLYRTRIIGRDVLRKYAIANWLAICLSGVCYLFVTSSAFILYSDARWENWFELAYHFILLAFDVNVIYLTQIIKILTIATRQWVEDAKHHTNIVKKSKEIKTNVCRWKNKETIFASILEAFNITKNAFQLLILYHCTETFIHAIFYVYTIAIIFKRSEDHSGPATAMLIGWILKNFFYETILSVEFERFIIAVNDATVSSIIQMSDERCSEHEQRMHRNVVRLSRITSKFEVCELFALDAATPRRLLALIATYTIVVLQFVLL